MVDMAMIISETYTKREAERRLNELTSEHGGVWQITSIGKRYGVRQAVTREEKTRADAIRHAEITLESRANWFRPEGMFSVYRTRDKLKDRLDEFAARFAQDPSHALEWGTSTFEAAAEYRVVREIIAGLEVGHSPRQVCENPDDEAARETRHETLSRSSSPTSDLMDQARRIALRKYAREVRAYVDALAEAEGVLYGAAEGLL
jgi:hypothetical protein